MASRCAYVVKLPADDVDLTFISRHAAVKARNCFLHAIETDEHLVEASVYSVEPPGSLHLQAVQAFVLRIKALVVGVKSLINTIAKIIEAPYGEGSRTLRQTTIFLMPPGAGSMPSAW